MTGKLESPLTVFCTTDSEINKHNVIPFSLYLITIENLDICLYSVSVCACVRVRVCVCVREREVYM